MKNLAPFLIILTLIGIQSVWAKETCVIESAHKIYRPEITNGLGIKDVIKHSDCPYQIQQSFSETILSSQGHFRSHSLANSFENFDVTIKPERLSVITLNDRLEETFDLPSRWHFSQLTGVNKKSTFLLSEQEQLYFHCSNCKATGNKRIQVDVSNNLIGQVKRFWLKGKVVVRQEALVAVANLPVNNKGLTPSDFKIQVIDTTTPEKLFTDRSQLVFYKTNKPLREGTPLKSTDLNAISIVQQGRMTKIISKGQGIQLSGIAIPTRSGRIGETIQLKHPKSKKTIIGQIIDFNKVKVEL